MATKTQSATATAPKKSKKKEIEKPKKVLREPLQHKKDLLEQLGWKFSQAANETWIAERLEGSDPWRLSNLSTIGSAISESIVVEEKNFITDPTADESVTMLEWRVKGWKFEQDEDQMWSATKGAQFVGKMSDLRPLLSCIEGEETGDHKTAIEKMTAQVVAVEIEKYRDEGWHFLEPSLSGKSIWLATNPSPAFPDNIRAETLPGIFDQIKKIKSENSEKLQKFNENLAAVQTESSPMITDAFTKTDLSVIEHNPHSPVFSGKSLEEIGKLINAKTPKGWTEAQKSDYWRAGNAARKMRISELLLRRDVELAFRQGGAFEFVVEGVKYRSFFWVDPGDPHLVFESDNYVPVSDNVERGNPISETGYRSDNGLYPLNYESFPEMIEKRVRHHVADQFNEFITKKQKGIKKVLAENLLFSNLTFARTTLGYTEFFEAEQSKQKLAEKSDWKLPVIVQFSIDEFIQKNEATALYLTDKGIVEVEYKNLAESKVSAMFFDETGGEHTERKKVFGKTLMDTLLSVEDFYKKFPMFAPKKTAATFLKNQSSASGSEFLIDLDLIVPSPFLSQTKRRARFTDEEITELASTIDQDGLISPIVVRVVGDNFEIVAGERRWLATQKLGKTQIAAFIKELSEQAAYRIQLIENLQRKQPEPLDEAVTYKEYMDKFGLTVQDLALEFGKPVKFIAGRLKLNDLIPDAFAAVESKRLPIGHAFEIAKHPAETQKTILKKAVYDSVWVGKENPQAKDGYLETIKPLAKLKDFIRRDVFHNLETASFSKSREDLFPKGLACINCPQRTHAKNLSSLFESDVISEQDQCLNPVCFGKRYDAHIEGKVQEIAAEENRPAEEVPYLASEYSSKYNGRNTVQSWKFQEVQNKNKCETTQKGVFIDGSQKGLVISFCVNKECPIHWKQAETETENTNQKLTPEEKRRQELEKAEEKQNSFETQLRTATRRQVLFDISIRENLEQELLCDDLLMTRLTALVFQENSGYGTKPLKEMVKKSGYELIEAHDTTDEKPTGWEDSILKMDDRTRLQLLFLALLNYDENTWHGESIEATKNLAGRFTLDYRKIEASILAQIAPDKFKSAANEYLQKINAGEDAKKPCFYFEKDYPDHPVEDDDDNADDDDDDDENDIGETSQG